MAQLGPVWYCYDRRGFNGQTRRCISISPSPAALPPDSLFYSADKELVKEWIERHASPVKAPQQEEFAWGTSG